ncbi:MAG: hypothetical protein DWH91_03360 [Planctomycetota bacterium]|nr:MAG: hypothetical protein DWH91_03360 [Planctomycetota bacterium]
MLTPVVGARIDGHLLENRNRRQRFAKRQSVASEPSEFLADFVDGIHKQANVILEGRNFLPQFPDFIRGRWRCCFGFRHRGASLPDAVMPCNQVWRVFADVILPSANSISRSISALGLA